MNIYEIYFIHGLRDGYCKLLKYHYLDAYQVQTIRRGSRGSEVILLQECLVNLGYSIGSAGVDGIFGPATDAAVRQFQNDKRLVVDGIVGPMTWGAISSACPSSHDGKKFGLHIGLNQVDPNEYGGWDGKLTACEFDAKDMESIAKSQGFSTKILLTKQATSQIVIDELENLSDTLAEGDRLILSYSGHGGQIPDIIGEEGDSQDETWVLYDRELVDDELYNSFSKFKPGVGIIVFSDSCHSGTVTRELLYRDLVPTINRDISKEDVRIKAIPENIQSNVYQKNKEMYNKIQKNSIGARSSISATVLLISGCQDNQESLDGDRNGLFTAKLRQVWNNGTFNGDYPAFHKSIVSKMPPTQTPNYFKIGTINPKFEHSKPFT